MVKKVSSKNAKPAAGKKAMKSPSVKKSKSAAKAKPARKAATAGRRQQTPSVRRQLITKDMSFGEVLQRFPQTFSVFSKYGMHCIGCSMSAYETVEQGAMAHGIDAKKFIDDLNAAASQK